MKTHYLKCWPIYFERMKDGSKKFEIRNNDRDFQTGDMLVLEEYDTIKKEYTGNRLTFAVNYTLHQHDGLYSDFVIMSLTQTLNFRN